MSGNCHRLLTKNILLQVVSPCKYNFSRHQSTHVEWNDAVSAAEKLVGYPPSYLTLHTLLSDEMSNIAQHLRKLMATSHPLMHTAKSLLLEGPQSIQQTRGLLVLLASKAAFTSMDDDSTAPQLLQHDAHAGVLHSQRSLAEITEMIHTAQQIHKGVVNLHQGVLNDRNIPSSNTDEEIVVTDNPDYEFGNKIAILCGDYLLANACKALAALKNSEVTLLVSSAISDFTEAEFLGPRDAQGRPVPSVQFDLDLWREQSYLANGSLLGKSCKSGLLLAGQHNSSMLQAAFNTGKHVAMACHALHSITPFVADADGSSSSAIYGPTEHGQIQVTSLPMVLHIEQLYRRHQSRSNSNAESSTITQLFRDIEHAADPDQVIVRAVMDTGRGAGVEMARDVLLEHCHMAAVSVQKLPESEARAALENIVNALFFAAKR